MYGRTDSDGDGIHDGIDNCPTIANPNQADLDQDGQGDVCDSDRDGDGVPNGSDVYPDDARYQTDSDGDGIADEWEQQYFGNLTTASSTTDTDGDGSSDLDEFRYGSDPTTAPAFRQAYQIATGWDHSLALKIDGRVLAWGYNSEGQLGDGSRINRAHPVLVKADQQTLLSDIRAVATGAGHSLALKADGTLRAWGRNNYGQLGDSTTTQRDLPVTVIRYAQGPAVSGVVAIATGANHSLALLSDGTVLTWGYNGYGQLGDGTTVVRYTPVQVVLDAQQTLLRGIIAIAAGDNYSLALRSDGTVLAWGYNGYGQLGDGSTTSRYYPVRVTDGSTTAPITQIQAIAAGYNHALAVKADGKAMGWGNNNYAQVGDGFTINRSRAVPVLDENDQPVTGIKTVAAGEWHSLALKVDGTVLAWGHNASGQLGDGTITDLIVPKNIGLSGINALAAGSEHSLALTQAGTVLAWGDNNYYQLGDGTVGDRRTPVQVINVNRKPVGIIGQPAAPNDPVADSDGDGTVNSSDAFPYDPAYKADTDGDSLPDEWETERFGNLATANATTDTDGDGSIDGDEFKHGSDPTGNPGIFPSSATAAGEYHSLALRLDGQVLAWGYNNYGQLGDGTTTGQTYPKLIPGMTNIRAVAAGSNHSLALKADGTVLAWGYNGYGQLGDGTTTNRSQPVTVQVSAGVPLRGVVAVAAGDIHNLALKSDGTVWAWGYNAYGQLGDGTTVNRLNPVLLTDPNGDAVRGIVAIAAGSNYSLALTADGKMLAWGYNGYGTLGDSTATQRLGRPSW